MVKTWRGGIRSKYFPVRGAIGNQEKHDQNTLNKSENAPESTIFEDTASLSMGDECCESLEIEDNEQLSEMYLPLKRSMLKAINLMDKELKLHPKIDCFDSGTTAITVVQRIQR